jgi:hypothetical protein
MAPPKKDVARVNRGLLLAIFQGIVHSHNALVQTRFTIAGLYLAATGFLANSWFGGLGREEFYYPIPILGLVLTLVSWLLEMRTFQMLSGLQARGRLIEGKLKVDSELGLFSLMASHPVPPRLPLIRLKLPHWNLIRYVISHSFGLDLLYGSVLVFWIYILWRDSCGGFAIAF